MVHFSRRFEPMIDRNKAFNLGELISSNETTNAISHILEAMQEHQTEETDRMNNMFLVVNGCTVLFMQCGFALLEAGAVRSKNVTNILLKNFLDALLGAIIYWAMGFAFAFGKVVDHSTDPPTYSKANYFIGHTHFFLMNDNNPPIHIDGYDERVIHYGSFYGEWFFNFVFAATATTITSGALAERVNLYSYFIYAVFLTGFIQPVTVHWTWSNGFLLYPPKSLNLPPAVYFRDYAGGCSVHAVGGLAAIVGSIFIGPRIGRFDEHTVHHIPGHSTPLTCLGGFILVTGFLGMVLGHSHNIELSATNIILGGSASGITAMFIRWVRPHLSVVMQRKKGLMGRKKARQYWSFLTVVDSALCGMVALCPGCNIIPTFGAVFIGTTAGLFYLALEHLLLVWKIDDPLGSFSVHFGGGVIGVVLTPLFMLKEHAGIDGVLFWKGCEEDKAVGIEGWEDGACLYSPFYQLAWHVLGLICISLWTITLSTIMFGLLWYTDIFRVHADLEIRGIDIRVHGEPAYPNAAYGHGWDNEGEFSLDVLDISEGLMRRNVKALINPNSKDNWNSKVEQGGLIAMAINTHRTMHRGGSVVEELTKKQLDTKPKNGYTTGRIQKRQNGNSRTLSKQRCSVDSGVRPISAITPEKFSNLVNMSRRVSVPNDMNIHYKL